MGAGIGGRPFTCDCSGQRAIGGRDARIGSTNKPCRGRGGQTPPAQLQFGFGGRRGSDLKGSGAETVQRCGDRIAKPIAASPAGPGASASDWFGGRATNGDETVATGAGGPDGTAEANRRGFTSADRGVAAA